MGTGAVLAVIGYVALLDLLIIWLARRRPRAALGDDEPVAAGAMHGQ
jgi:hypothetical protein